MFHQTEWPFFFKTSTNNLCWKGCGEKGPSRTVGGDVNWCSHCGQQNEGSSENQRCRVTQQSHSSGRLPGQNYDSERGVHPYVQSNTIYISRDTETKMSIKRWTDKENVVYLHIATPWIVGH